jgi:hypothetical protein
MWLRSAELATRNQRLYPGGYRVVRYETFADDPVEVVAAICSFVGESFLPSMAGVARGLRFGAATPASPPGLVAPELSAAEAAFVDRYAGRELTRFGYPRVDPPPTRRDPPGFGLATWPVSRLAMVTWRVLRARPTTVEGW